MRYFLALVWILTQWTLSAQITEDFSDGDFTSNPTWSGTDADYEINSSFQLHVNNTIAATSYLSTPHGLSTLDNKEWRVWTRQSFAPSSSNYGRIYLTAASADLSTLPDGFYLQLGEAGSNDAIQLIRRSGGSDTPLIVGPLAQIASSFSVGIRVFRDNLGNWSLFIDDTGGQNYTLAGTTNDPTVLLGTHFGFMDVYTVSNATNFYHDDIYVGDEIIDSDPPVLVSATVVSATEVDALFDEALESVSAQNVANYSLLPALGISSAVQDGSNPALIHLTVSSAFTNGTTYQLNASNIGDLVGNIALNLQTSFDYLIAETPAWGDVLINEFMCDPDPSQGLPPVEYVEIHNVSNKIFDITGWKLGDASSAGTAQTGWLQPGDYRVLCATANVDSFTLATAVTSFPSLNNAGDNIVLRSDLGVLIDSLTYTDDWYVDASKSDGGYSIERINPEAPCSGVTNWAASNASNGGTPGTINSIYDNTPDTQVPAIEMLLALPPNYLEITFTEGMDSLSLANAVISVSPTLAVQNVYVLESYPTSIILEFASNLVPSQIYTITLNGAADCSQNAGNLQGSFALPETAQAGDVLINEILFNPVTGGYDWVEVYNHSNKLIDLYEWQVADFDNDTIANLKTVPVHFFLAPDSYAVFAEDTLEAKMTFYTHEAGRFIEMDLPSWSNDSGTVFLIADNVVLDKVSYLEDWHFQFLDDFDGKSLERIDPEGPSNDHNNWHTAAEAIGFGTPGLKNSQYYPAVADGDFAFTSETISPDNDGFEDVLQVNFALPENGLLGDFSIYDDRGRLIATVFKAELLGSTGTFVWDGTRDDDSKASIGTYVAVFEAFSIDGEARFAKRKAFVVAGKL
jgi:hypothetical protein